jgi:hypothetical protein
VSNLLDECNNSTSPFLFKHVYSNQKNNSVIDQSLSGFYLSAFLGGSINCFPQMSSLLPTKWPSLT